MTTERETYEGKATGWIEFSPVNLAGAVLLFGFEWGVAVAIGHLAVAAIKGWFAGG